MAQEVENPSAFACASDDAHQPGMTLRDWFAGQALVGRSFIVADPHDDLTTVSGLNLMTAEGMAASCYELADAMLAARKVAAS